MRKFFRVVDWNIREVKIHIRIDVLQNSRNLQSVFHFYAKRDVSINQRFKKGDKKLKFLRAWEVKGKNFKNEPFFMNFWIFFFWLSGFFYYFSDFYFIKTIIYSKYIQKNFFNGKAQNHYGSIFIGHNFFVNFFVISKILTVFFFYI